MARALERAALQVCGVARVLQAALEPLARDAERAPSDGSRAREQELRRPRPLLLRRLLARRAGRGARRRIRPAALRWWGFLVCNYWTESLEYRYRPVTTNGRARGAAATAGAHRHRPRDGGSGRELDGHRGARRRSRCACAGCWRRDAGAGAAPREARGAAEGVRRAAMGSRAGAGLAAASLLAVGLGCASLSPPPRRSRSGHCTLSSEPRRTAPLPGAASRGRSALRAPLVDALERGPRRRDRRSRGVSPRSRTAAGSARGMSWTPPRPASD